MKYFHLRFIFIPTNIFTWMRNDNKIKWSTKLFWKSTFKMCISAFLYLFVYATEGESQKCPHQTVHFSSIWFGIVTHIFIHRIICSRRSIPHFESTRAKNLLPSRVLFYVCLEFSWKYYFRQPNITLSSKLRKKPINGSQPIDREKIQRTLE